MDRKQRPHNDLYVYKSTPAEESPFETYVRNSNEKNVVASYIRTRAMTLGTQPGRISVLDIGCGDGSLAVNAFSQVSIDVNYTGVEPATNLCTVAHQALNAHLPEPHFINDYFSPELLGDAKYQIIIASNLYHLGIDEVAEFIRQARSLLAKDGELLFIYRGTDDGIAQFRLRFESLLYEDYRLPRNVEDILLACKIAGLSYSSVDDLIAKVTLPENAEALRIIEFIMNLGVADLPDGMLTEMLEYVSLHNRELTSTQTVITFRRD